MLPAPLQPLAAWPQFVGWRLETLPDGKTAKIPYSPITSRLASSTDPSHWSTYERAAALPGMSGVGFVFTAQDPFFFLDIDKAYDGRAWSPLSQSLLQQFAGAAVEVSQSGSGLHVIGSHKTPLDHTNKNKLAGLELYTQERFVALTGFHASGSVSTVHDAALATIVATYFDPAARAAKADDWTTEPVAEWAGPEDDGELLSRALASGGKSAASVFGDGDVTFADLWSANADVLGKKWPSPGRAFDASSADQALANLLAYWTGKNCERMERMMRLSALAREKWDYHHSYLQTTILKAVGFVRNVLQLAPPAPPPPPPETLTAAGYQPRGSGGIMLHARQLEHFAGCVYIMFVNKVLTPAGDLLDQARFDVIYGGYLFTVDLDGSKTSVSAWEAFTRNQGFAPPVAHGICFRPEIPMGQMATTGNRKLANLYVPIDTPRTPGDPAPFLGLLAKLLPEARDRAILLTYMAALKQNPGAKFQWWPVIQGAEGNGKSFIAAALRYAIGEQYTHLPNTEKMIRSGMNFNGWIEGKLLVILEEVYAAHRREFFDGFKATVTNDTLPIERKGVEEIIGDNRANGLILTNNKEGVPITDANRRYCVFFTAQQAPGDLYRDGMIDEPGGRTSRYFKDLYDWARGRGEYASMGADYGWRIINDYLATLPLVAEFDPTGIAQRAPLTSSTQEAIESSFGRIEQEIREAIQEERPGFIRPWVSSIALATLCERKGANVPPAKRRDVMRSLGYDYHPALPRGRVDNVVTPDNGKPALFVQLDSIAALNMTDRRAIADAYSASQQKALNETSKAGKVFK